MQNSNYRINIMSRNEFDTAIEWAANEGWNPGLNDAECFYANDPKGFLAGFLDDEIVATISAVKYGNTFGFIGFYIVKPEYRGKGYGIQLWNAGMKYLEGRNIALDGVVAQQDNYRKSGFRLAYRNIRFQGQAGIFPKNHHSKIISLSSLPFEAVDSYDRQFFPEKRTVFTECWINQTGCRALGMINTDNGRLSGYGVIRKCRSGYKIGPLFADNPELADSLLVSLCSELKSDDIFYLDIPEPNLAAVEMAEKYNMNIVFETARMYTEKAPDIPLDGIFGVTSFELG